MHPSKNGYRVIAEAVADACKRLPESDMPVMSDNLPKNRNTGGHYAFAKSGRS
jgi:hypothetical protein